MNIYVLFIRLYLNIRIVVQAFFLFFISFFYYFFLFLFCLNAYLFCGDFIHGKGSYFLIMHSSLAIITRICFYIFIFILFILLLLSYLHWSYIFSYFKYLFFILNIYCLFYYFLFLFTGILWGDYAWGFPVSIEYRFILLCLYIAVFSCIIFYYMFNFFIFYLLSIFLLLILFFYEFPSVYSHLVYQFGLPSILSSIKGTELHQSDASLHFFLLSISGYYIALIFLYIISIVVLLSFMFVSVLYYIIFLCEPFIFKFYSNLFQRYASQSSIIYLLY
jgi:hypothetical protein